jgi:hypothetical protein
MAGRTQNGCVCAGQWEARAGVAPGRRGPIDCAVAKRAIRWVARRCVRGICGLVVIRQMTRLACRIRQGIVVIYMAG